MIKTTCVLLLAGLYAEAGAGPQFEVASMRIARLSAAGAGGRRVAAAAQIRYPNVSLLFLLMTAYRLKQFEQVDGAPWIRSQRYDIDAKLQRNASQDQIPEMLQALLADRLKLSAHQEFALDLRADSPAKPEDFQAAFPLREALEEELGLRLEARKEPANVVVVDRAEPIPVEN